MLDKEWIKREIKIKTIDEISEKNLPIFIKPVIPKSFTASVFYTLNDFEKATHGIEKNEEILTSTLINDIKAEARAYLKNGLVLDIALYEGNADINEGKLFLQNFAVMNSKILPEVLVIDIAYSKSLGWFVLEFNACWAAGLNNCKAEKVIDCIIDATKN
ncbi:MAG: ATP-grasp domain-containing protein [Flavobacterium sp.]